MNWISVKDAMPELAGHYLCNLESEPELTSQTRKYIEVRFIIGNISSVRIGERITHWMPLPEPPKEEQ